MHFILKKKGCACALLMKSVLYPEYLQAGKRLIIYQMSDRVGLLERHLTGFSRVRYCTIRVDVTKILQRRYWRNLQPQIHAAIRPCPNTRLIHYITNRD